MIVGILGSASPTSGTRTALDAVARRCRAAGHEFDLVDLAVEYRELHDVARHDAPPPGSQIAALRARVRAADALVLATPVHHGTFSGLLKNALDHLAGDEFAGRPVGLLAHGSGAKAVTGAVDSLRPVVRALQGWSTPTGVGVAAADLLDGIAPLVETRIEEMVEQIDLFLGRTRRVPEAAVGVVS
ncbi:NADPH-dependent FMN reductase [Actinomycetospora corticicola]|uniref:NAD(P)H-dependent FMN reductase n=1 Tax=Actinomycetospora corticicola TaxID=663602 RepID=A0A7Y9J4B3_9PSEU|nr:NADPH-dependent FMN reductase [Actinomycetospora corticicola]NYD34509.1 NAD(P)H-dependent FMN reductase [Actinomycetospora corticicola]